MRLQILDTPRNLCVNNIKPLTLTIIPQSPVQPTTIQTPIQPTIQIPNFDHVPMAPTIVQNSKNVRNMTLEELQEKERLRLEKQRQRKARYNEKVKNYTKIGTQTIIIG